MKVKELIEYLKKCDQDALVVMCEDSEGNGYKPLRITDETFYTAEDGGEVVEEGADYSAIPNYEKAVCFWP